MLQFYRKMSGSDIVRFWTISSFLFPIIKGLRKKSYLDQIFLPNVVLSAQVLLISKEAFAYSISLKEKGNKRQKKERKEMRNKKLTCRKSIS